MLTTEAEIIVQGGHGGPGKVSFFPAKGGPSGGNGGRGGDVYFVVNPNTPDLRKYREQKSFAALNGEPGSQNRMHGKNADPLELAVPPGTTATDIKTGERFELTRDQNQLLICRGGLGGRGNNEFKTPTRQTPRKAEPGLPGQERTLKLSLQLIADYGFIGLPNVGKSTLLNALTRAGVKTANYAFTTLEPNLGVCRGRVLADIPGLIEGASVGRGLGSSFLKHIEKVRVLFHCISAESADARADYEAIRKELAAYNPALLSKKEIILITKTDTSDAQTVKRMIDALGETGNKIVPVTVLDDACVAEIADLIV